MIVLHAVPDATGRMWLWAEDGTALWAHTAPRASGTDADEVPAHPFAADLGVVERTLNNVGIDLSVDDVETRRLQLLLPTTDDGPEPSPRLDRPEASESAAESVDPWLVQSIHVGPEELDSLVDAIADKDSHDAIGATVRYWYAVREFAEQLVDDRSVAPHLASGDSHGIAVWRGYPTDSTTFDCLQHLHQSMPPLARAAVPSDDTDGGSSPGEPTAEDGRSTTEALTATLDRFVDFLVREKISSASVDRFDRELDDVHERWLTSLTGRDATFAADRDELSELHRQLEEWLHPEQVLDESGRDDEEVRLCFRLREPQIDPERVQAVEEGSSPIAPDDWTLEFLLQSESDPSLIVEASGLRDPSSTPTATLSRHLERPEDVLLEELTRATSLCPILERALGDSVPTCVELSNDEAARFLRERAELLRQSGFGVILPEWWDDPGGGLSARLVASSDDRDASKPSRLDLDRLRGFEWEVVLDDRRVSERELEDLASIKQPLVHFDGRWMSLDEDEVESAMDLYERDAKLMPQADPLRADPEQTEPEAGLPVTEPRFGNELDRLFETDVQEWIESAETPPLFDGELRDYQKRGLGWMSYLEELGFGGCLADDMGLGKTVQVLARLAEERSRDSSIGPTLVVCPVSVLYNWRDETHRFLPQVSVYVHHGSDRRIGEALVAKLQDHDVVVTTYGTARNDIDWLREIQFHRVVLDEAQKIKNSNAARSEAIRQLSTRHRWALTGTPIENRLTELWSIMEFCNPGLLGPESDFRATFARPIEEHEDEDKTARLRRLIRPFTLRRKKTDETVIDDLPEKSERKVPCSLTQEQATLYKAVTDELFEEIENAASDERSGKVFKLIYALKAICNHPRQYLEDDGDIEGRSGKLERLAELAECISESGDRALVFTQYTSMAELIREYFEDQLGFDLLYLHGGTSKGARDELIDTFQSEDGPSFFLLSLQAGGTGMNLTAANHVVHYDRWWNPAVEDQATDRAYRIGQDDHVQVHKFVCRGTIEDQIDRMIEEKKDLADRILEGHDWLTELSNEELRDIVTLSEESIA